MLTIDQCQINPQAHTKGTNREGDTTHHTKWKYMKYENYNKRVQIQAVKRQNVRFRFAQMLCHNWGTGTNQKKFLLASLANRGT